MVAHIGMVTGQYEDGIVKPRLTTCPLEELANSHVGITDAFVNRNALFWIYLLILLRKNERMMA